MKTDPCPLADLLKSNRNAVSVFVTLQRLSRGRRQVNTSRATISGLCGLSERVIGSAIEALHRGGWLCRNYGRSGKDRRWYRITLAADGIPWNVSNADKVTRSCHRCAKVEKATIGKTVRVQKIDHREPGAMVEKSTYSLKREGASTARPPLGAVDGPTITEKQDTDGWHPWLDEVKPPLLAAENIAVTNVDT